MSTETPLAPTCHQCGYALAGLACGPCPECGATDITLTDDEARRAKVAWDAQRVPSVLTLCIMAGSLAGLVKLAMLVINPGAFPSPILAAMGAIVCFGPAVLAWWFVSDRGPAKTSTAENITRRRVAVNVAGAAMVLAGLAMI